MSEDYVSSKYLPGYYANEWFDYFAKNGQLEELSFEYPDVEISEFSSSFHRNAVDSMVNFAKSSLSNPQSYLEIGAALGRTFFEVCSHYSNLSVATLIEPSKNLFDGCNKLLSHKKLTVPVTYGNEATAYIGLDTTKIFNTVATVETKLINEPFDQCNFGSQKFDLVVCLNVLDQCRKPLDLIDFIKKVSHPSSVVVLADSYQWPSNHCTDKNFRISNIKDCFREWTVLGEKNIEFRLRQNERYYLSFLSHLVVFQASLKSTQF